MGRLAGDSGAGEVKIEGVCAGGGVEVKRRGWMRYTKNRMDTRGFHADIRAIVLQQPVCKFVNIYTAAGWKYDFHTMTSSIKITRRMQGLNRQAIKKSMVPELTE